jgi:hypothetical protein
MRGYLRKALDRPTWPDFAAVVERKRGVWGGCWCLEFHPEGGKRGPHRREQKECRVREGTAHAALVFDGSACVGWCQFGLACRIARIKHQRAYGRRPRVASGLENHVPGSVDKAYREKGVCRCAIAGALDEIARLGGGTVESYPRIPRTAAFRLPFSTTEACPTLREARFERVRLIGRITGGDEEGRRGKPA